MNELDLKNHPIIAGPSGAGYFYPADYLVDEP